MPHTDALDRTLLWIGAVTLGGAAFPRLAYRMRWSTRLGPRGFVAYVAISTILGFAVRTWLVPIFKTAGERQRRALNDLRQQFGREPTSEELASYLGFDSLR